MSAAKCTKWATYRSPSLHSRNQRFETTNGHKFTRIRSVHTGETRRYAGWLTWDRLPACHVARSNRPAGRDATSNRWNWIAGVLRPNVFWYVVDTLRQPGRLTHSGAPSQTETSPSGARALRPSYFAIRQKSRWLGQHRKKSPERQHRWINNALTCKDSIS